MRKRLLDVFKRTFKLETVDEYISKANCHKWDSLNHLNLVVEIETEFNISLEPNEIGEIKDFSSAERIIMEKVNL
jgi:acyl carrier protein